jgi:tetratricopeptide (TPR) repeat protein
VLDLLEQNLDLREFDFIDAGYQNLYLSVLELFSAPEVQDPRRWALIEDEKGDIRWHRGEVELAFQRWDAAHRFFAGQGKDKARIADLCWKRGMALHKLGRAKEAQAAVQEGLAAAPADDVARGRLEALRTQLRG